jgi:hypothetical protein
MMDKAARVKENPAAPGLFLARRRPAGGVSRHSAPARPGMRPVPANGSSGDVLRGNCRLHQCSA